MVIKGTRLKSFAIDQGFTLPFVGNAWREDIRLREIYFVLLLKLVVAAKVDKLRQNKYSVPQYRKLGAVKES